MAKKRATRKADRAAPEPCDQDVALDLGPPRVSWHDDSHAAKARGPKGVLRRIEAIAKRVWRLVPEPAKLAMTIVPHNILLMSGPVVELPPDIPADEASTGACYDHQRGVMLDVEGEASDPMADRRFAYFIAHELAHAYRKATSMLIHSGAIRLARLEGMPPFEVSKLNAIAAAFAPESKRERGPEEVMVTALAVAWGFGPDYLVAWIKDREDRGVSADDPDSAGALAFLARRCP